MQKTKRVRWINKISKQFLVVAVIVIVLSGLPFTGIAGETSEIPGVRLSVKPLDLSRAPATEELMAARPVRGTALSHRRHRG